IMAVVEFQNIKCDSLDKEFSDFDYCFLKSVNRSYKYYSVKVKLFQIPVTKVKVNVALFKRFNGYRPFLYNITIDACRFFHNQKSNPVAQYFYSLYRDVSNINHSCPYNHDLVVDKVTTQRVNTNIVKIIPFPEGDYMIMMNWIAYDINRAVFKLYISLS
ncbi:hypothetical protein KR067_001059, partial [Drosophila pandora]